MVKVITAPEPVTYGVTDATIFLAGAIDMGNAVDWQAYVLEIHDSRMPVKGRLRLIWEVVDFADQLEKGDEHEN